MNTTLEDKKVTTKIAKDQKGQTMVEFILLLSGIVIISFSFMKLVNGNIANRWEKMANIILDDKNQTLRLR